MKNNYLGILSIISVILIAGYILYPQPRAETGLDLFAQCLADTGITMYGAAWCSHCQNEKKAFGDSFRLVPYVECPDDPEQCLAAGIRGYPTWVFPDGTIREGEQGLTTLSEESGCVLSGN